MFRPALQVVLVPVCLFLVLISQYATGQEIALAVDQSQSNLTVSIAGSSDSSSITGTGGIVLMPPMKPFSLAQITALDLVLADGFSIGFLGGLVSINASPNDVSMTLVTPGEAGAVNGANQFDQLGNEAAFSGEISLFDPFNLVGGSQTLVLDGAGTSFFDALGVQLAADAGLLTMSTSFDVEVPVNDTISIAVSGALVLTGKLPDEVLLGDVNCDGVVSLLDVAPFVAHVISGEYSVKADINQDLAVNLRDIAPFVDLLTN